MTLKENNKKILDLIFTIRGESVILDRDLARLFQVETRVFNQAVKRHLNKFDQFMFQLTNDEKQDLIINCNRLSSIKFSPSNPYVFNEYGVLMAASILNSDVAIEINRKVIKAFVFLRQKIFTNSDFIALKEQINRIEAEQENVKLNQKLDSKIQDNKLMQLSREVQRFSKIMDEFQDAHLILKKSDILGGNLNDQN